MTNSLLLVIHFIHPIVYLLCLTALYYLWSGVCCTWTCYCTASCLPTCSTCIDPNTRRWCGPVWLWVRELWRLVLILPGWGKTEATLWDLMRTCWCHYLAGVGGVQPFHWFWTKVCVVTGACLIWLPADGWWSLPVWLSVVWGGTTWLLTVWESTGTIWWLMAVITTGILSWGSWGVVVRWPIILVR